MEFMDESKPDEEDPNYEDGPANHVGSEDVAREDTAAAAAEEIKEPSPLPISVRPTLNSLTSGTVPVMWFIDAILR